MCKFSEQLKLFPLLALATLLAACGGGSSSDDLADDVDYSDSTLQITAGAVAPDAFGVVQSDISLFWEQRNKYDFYRLFINADGRSGYTKIGPDIPVEVPEDDVSAIFLSRNVVADLQYRLIPYEFDWKNALFMLRGCKGSGSNAECETVDFQTAEYLSGGVIDGFTSKSPDNTFQTTFGVSVAMSKDSLVAAIGANTASLFECAADEIIVLELGEQATENCEKETLKLCSDYADGEDVPEDCLDEQPDDPVYKVVVNAGAVYMYYRDTVFSDWQLAPVVHAPFQSENDNFGWSIDLSDDGTVLAVTAPGEDSEAVDKPRNNKQESSGAAYVFRRDGDEWLYEDFLKAVVPQANDLLGWAVELSGDGTWLASSALQRNKCRGTVFMYQQEGDGWSQQQTLTAPVRRQNDVFGFSLSLDYAGATLAVGANQFPDTRLIPGCVPGETRSQNAPGEAHIFARSGSSWEYTASVTASNAENGDRFGNSVALNSNAGGNGRATRLLVGAPLEGSDATGVNGGQGNSDITPASGAAYLFEKRGAGNWQQTQYYKASNSGATDQFGNTVRLGSRGDIAVIGAWGEAGTGVGINPIEEFDRAPATGAVYIFREDASPGLWMQQAYVKPPFLSLYAGFGWSIAISDTSRAMLIGAPGFASPNGSTPGNVFFY